MSWFLSYLILFFIYPWYAVQIREQLSFSVSFRGQMLLCCVLNVFIREQLFFPVCFRVIPWAKGFYRCFPLSPSSLSVIIPCKSVSHCFFPCAKCFYVLFCVLNDFIHKPLFFSVLVISSIFKFCIPISWRYAEARSIKSSCSLSF